MSAAAINAGDTTLGIELGSTRIKACLIDANSHDVLATGSHEWENQLVEGLWSYALDEVWSGIQAAYADLAATVQQQYGESLQTFGAIGVSAMMHGYLAFDSADNLLVSFRTWRNTNTAAAASELTDVLGVNIPQRWSIAHLHQAVLDSEAHVPHLSFLTTLAGYVHWQLTDQRVLGVGDASGMFPIDSAIVDYDAALIERYEAHTADRLPSPLRTLLPQVLPAGAPAGNLTDLGAALLDPSGALRAGAALCAPEGDAGTGMVATNAVTPRTGNVSVGTSVFAMIVLERALERVHEEIDLVTTPAGAPVAMVHCNNGASELAEWVGLFTQFATAAGTELSRDAVFETLFREALAGEADAGGLLAYNYLAGEPVTGLTEGRPAFVRTPDSRFTLANTMRSHLYGVFATLSLGMRVLQQERVAVDNLFAHGGLFRTAGVAQRFLAGALNTSVTVGESASEGGAWGIAVLAAYRRDTRGLSLSDYLHQHVFASAESVTVQPDPSDVAGFTSYLTHYEAGLAIEAAAVAALPSKGLS